MLKRELVNEVSQQLGDYYKQDVSQAVDIILEEIAQALIEERRVEIRGFGSFSLNYRPPRAARNPKTGEKVDVPAKYVPHFKPGKELRDRVDTAVAVPVPFRKVA